jgi:hypothetical protein
MERAPKSVLDSGFRNDFVANPRAANRVMMRKSLSEKWPGCVVLSALWFGGHMMFPWQMSMKGAEENMVSFHVVSVKSYF